MAIDTQAYYYLVDPVAQFENNAGKPIIGGWCEIYEAGTDTKVISLQDFDGTNNPFKVKLGSDGRCVMLVDIGKKYDLYVYDSFGNLALSRLNILPLTNGDVTVQGLTKVYHDSTTLSGDGTPTSPLTVIGGGGGGLSTVATEWPVVGDGSSADPVTINDLTLLAHDDTLTSYDAEIEGKKSLVLGVNGDWFSSATSGFQEKSDMSNYVTNQTFINSNNSLNTKIDTKLDTSAFSAVSGSFALSSDVNSSLAGKQDTLTAGSNIEIENNIISVTGEMGKIYSGVGTISVDNTSNQISIDDSGYAKLEDMPNVFIGKYGVTTFDEITQALTDEKAIIITDCPGQQSSVPCQAYFAGKDMLLSKYYFVSTERAVIGSNTHIQPYSVSRQDQWVPESSYVIASTSYVTSTVNSAVSGKLNTTAFSEVSGNFLTAHQSLEGYATESFVTNITDNKLDTSVYSSTSGDFALKSEIPSVVGFMEESKLEYNTDNLISGYNGSAFAGQGGEDLATKSWVNDQGFAKESDIPSLDGYATESWVNGQGFLTAHQSLDGYAKTADLTAYYPITGGNLKGSIAASGAGSTSNQQTGVVYAKITNTTQSNRAGLSTNGSVLAGDYGSTTSQTIGVRRKISDTSAMAGRFQLYSDGNVSFQQISNNGTADSIVCQLQYGQTTTGFNWGTMTSGTTVKHIAYTEDIPSVPVIGTIEV